MSTAIERYIHYYETQAKTNKHNWQWFVDEWDQIQRAWDTIISPFARAEMGY